MFLYHLNILIIFQQIQYEFQHQMFAERTNSMSDSSLQHLIMQNQPFQLLLIPIREQDKTELMPIELKYVKGILNEQQAIYMQLQTHNSLLANSHQSIQHFDL